jgi:hypothetical protein
LLSAAGVALCWLGLSAGGLAATGVAGTAGVALCWLGLSAGGLAAGNACGSFGALGPSGAAGLMLGLLLGLPRMDAGATRSALAMGDVACDPPGLPLNMRDVAIPATRPRPAALAL